MWPFLPNGSFSTFVLGSHLQHPLGYPRQPTNSLSPHLPGHSNRTCYCDRIPELLAPTSLTHYFAPPNFNTVHSPPPPPLPKLDVLPQQISDKRLILESDLAKQTNPDILPSIIVPTIHSQKTYDPQTVPLKEQNDSFSYFPYCCELFDLENPRRPELNPDFLQYEELSLSQQIHEFLKTQKLSTDQIRTRWQIAFDTLYLLRQYYPQCELLVSGSLFTEISNTDSDVDMQVDLYGSNTNQQQLDLCKLRDEVHFKVFEGRYCPQSHSPLHNFMTGEVLMEKHVPLIRFCHGPTGTKCDLTFGNKISVQNSKLLKFYMEYDPRVKQLLVFLRYWMRFHKLSGKLKIKQCALSLMVLVFLMDWDVLPSVEFLQNLNQPELPNEHVYNGWNANFCASIPLVIKKFKRGAELSSYARCEQLGTVNFIEMMLGFFHFYGNLNLSEQVISPWHGKVICKQDFDDTLLIRLGGIWGKDTEKGFGKGRSIYIQDPFVHNFNVGEGVAAEHVCKFQKACRITDESLREVSKRSSVLELFIPV